MDGFIEMQPGLWYERATGRPWSTRVKRNVKGHRGSITLYDGPLHPLTNKTGKGYYRVRHGGSKHLWHSLVWEYFNGPKPDGMDVDHTNNNPADNRVENLQLLTHKQNSQCCRAYANNSTGYPGVTWNKRKRKYTAQIRVDGHRKHLGRFHDPKEAYQAYLDAKIKYHGPDSIRALPKEPVPCATTL